MVMGWAMLIAARTRLFIVLSALWAIVSFWLPDAYPPASWWVEYFTIAGAGIVIVFLATFGAAWILDAIPRAGSRDSASSDVRRRRT